MNIGNSSRSPGFLRRRLQKNCAVTGTVLKKNLLISLNAHHAVGALGQRDCDHAEVGAAHVQRIKHPRLRPVCMSASCKPSSGASPAKPLGLCLPMSPFLLIRVSSCGGPWTGLRMRLASQQAHPVGRTSIMVGSIMSVLCPCASSPSRICTMQFSSLHLCSWSNSSPQALNCSTR